MSQSLLSPEKDIAHWRGFREKPVHVPGGGVGKIESHLGIWRKGGRAKESK